MKKYITLLFLLPGLAFGYSHHRNYHHHQPTVQPTPKPPVIIPTPPVIVPKPVPPVIVSPQTGSIKAIDTNTATGNAQWYIDLYRSGVRLFIIDGSVWQSSCAPNPEVQRDFALALGAGLKVGMYTRNPNCWPQGLQAAGIYKSQLQFFAIDIEAASDGLSASAPATQAMVDGITAQGVRPIMYTDDISWKQINKNSTAFSSLPLWEPNTTTMNFTNWNADVNAVQFYPFGGWTKLMGSQQKFDYYFEGIDVDLDSFVLQ